jgi:hypothetical protein
MPTKPRAKITYRIEVTKVTTRPSTTTDAPVVEEQQVLRQERDSLDMAAVLKAVNGL